MVQSMTGYGKSEIIYENNKLTIEIRSVNGKNSDINIKTSLIPREKEFELKQIISRELQRGSIDLYTSMEYSQENSVKTLNKNVLNLYLKQIRDFEAESGLRSSDNELLAIMLRMPETFEQNKKDQDEDAQWRSFKECLMGALNALNEFRSTEGLKLAQDMEERVSNIINFLEEAEQFEQERVSALRNKFTGRLSELSVSPDLNRLEQEIIYYIEKLDITEEKVRLRQHCKYFLDTMRTEQCPGKKLGFIAQEMGREINTLGSKANHASIQKCVVKMKDELEKIKEQSLNIL